MYIEWSLMSLIVFVYNINLVDLKNRPFALKGLVNVIDVDPFVKLEI